MLAVMQKRDIGIGTEGSKGEASVSVSIGGRTRNMSEMFVKDARESGRLLEVYEILYDAFQKAKENGEIDYIPLPPTVRVNGKKVIATDMTQGGKNVIIDRHYSKLIEAGEIPWEFELNNKAENIEQVEKIYKIANSVNVYLSFDSFAVVADRQTGIGKLYLIDLGHIAPYKGPNRLGFGETEARAIAEGNKSKFQSFIRYLEGEKY